MQKEDTVTGRIAQNVAAAKTDDELRSLLLKGKDKTVRGSDFF
jgi:hypothetical protein